MDHSDGFVTMSGESASALLGVLADYADAEEPRVYAERLAVAYPTRPGEPDDVAVPGWYQTNSDADMAIRDTFTREAVPGARLVRLVTTVHEVEEETR
jgi:hypothetical protein